MEMGNMLNPLALAEHDWQLVGATSTTSDEYWIMEKVVALAHWFQSM